MTCGHPHKPRAVAWLARAVFTTLGVVALTSLALLLFVDEQSPLVHVAQAGLVVSVALSGALWCDR